MCDSRCGLSFSHESNYVFGVLCDVVFGYVVLFAFDVCDFKICPPLSLSLSLFFGCMRPVMFLLYCSFLTCVAIALGVCDFKMWLTFVRFGFVFCFAGSESLYDLAGLVTTVI